MKAAQILRNRILSALACALACAPVAAWAISGSVRAVGGNDNGQLGDGTTTQRLLPVQSVGMTDVIAVAGDLNGGSDHFTLAAKADGSVWSWGANNSGELGDGTTTTRVSPIQVPGLTNATSVAAGYTHSLALRSDGTIRGWGENGSGQLGDGSSTNRTSPVVVTGISSATAISAGESHSMALLSDGTIRAWGYNGTGRLGDGTTTTRLTPVSVSGMNSAIAMAAGAMHSVAVKAGGTVWTWGANYNGQLGDGTTTERWTPTQVAGLSDVIAVAASYHNLALKSDGTVWAWGSNGYGQLGDGTTAERHSPIQVPGLTGVVAIAARNEYSLAILSNGTVRGWGMNVTGQLGTGTTISQSTPVPVQGLSGTMCIGIGGGRFHGLFVVVNDTDTDGTPDSQDGCPTDANKTQPGICGCGRSDAADCNTNGVADCLDISGVTSVDCDSNGVPDECQGSLWIGADAASFNVASNWSPTGLPVNAVLRNNAANDNRCRVTAPGETGVCSIGVQGVGAGRQILEVAGGSVLRVAAAFQNGTRGVTRSLTGGGLMVNATRVEQTGTLEVRAEGWMSFDAAFTNSSGGLITLLGGALSSLGLTNAGGASISGFGALDGGLTNQGNMICIADTQVVGDLANYGTITLQSGILTVTGNLSGSGTIIGGFGGRDAGGESGLVIAGDFDTAADPARLDLRRSILQMNGRPAGLQRLEVFAPDRGRAVQLEKDSVVYIQSLRIGPNQTTVRLVNLRANTASPLGEALYVQHLILDPGATLDLAGQKLYYGRMSPSDMLAPISYIHVTDSIGGGALLRLETRAAPTSPSPGRASRMN